MTLIYMLAIGIACQIPGVLCALHADRLASTATYNEFDRVWRWFGAAWVLVFIGALCSSILIPMVSA